VQLKGEIEMQDLHASQPVLHTGAGLSEASAAMIMIHGRGASAEDIIGLAGELERPDLAFLAPQAAGGTWYPQRFVASLESNQPWLDWALVRIDALIAHVGAAGIPPERVVLLGFSQGACLVLEYAARNTRRYGGVIGLSGGLIGPDDLVRHDTGSLAGTPVFLGCSDIDFHIPKERVLASAEVLRQLEGAVESRLYPGMGHTINQDELAYVRGMLEPFRTVGSIE
jgi:phospholipase/carboxylesterase